MRSKVREFREKNAISQAQLAEKVGVSRQTINYLEKGKYIPSLTLAMKIAKEFNINVEELFSLEDEDEMRMKGPEKKG